ncbi:MAG: imidazole glycerol phosphate synthase subunit HisF [Bacteroidales bacterium]|nr:imidazole glycerol phosphate synthase subunit HisF [Bacteroidales bacterium]
MVAKRLIPCLDVHEGKTVKGVNFVNLREVGDPVQMGKFYAREGADELVYLDISATKEGRKTFITLVRSVARELNIPFTVGGGISDIDHASALLDAGADKITLNSAAICNPGLITQISKRYGSQFVVVAIDAKFQQNRWMVMSRGGTKDESKILSEWAVEACERGAGEILFTSMDHDGTKSGFACEALSDLCKIIPTPVIASGGAGTMDHFLTLFQSCGADAALAASVFHNREIVIGELKSYLHQNGIRVRL